VTMAWSGSSVGCPAEPPNHGTGGLSIDDLPVAAFLVAGDRIVDINQNAMFLLDLTDRAHAVGHLVSELLILGDAVAMGGGGVPLSDGAGSVWRHALARPSSGPAIPVLVTRGDQGGDAPAFGARTLLVAVPSSGQRDVVLDVEAKEESRERIAGVFANLAHEMRTPLNAVIGFGEIMLGEHFGPITARYKDYARDIVGAGYHLLSLVNGALDLGRASAGPDSLDERPVELRMVVISAITMLQPAASAKSIALDVIDLAGLPLIYADETRMRQLFVNLIGNAVKYSPVGRTVAIRHAVDADGEIRVEVVDQGSGMTRDEIAIAMLPFGRTESAIRAGEAGTGLGLPICKAIVESHGGRLEIDSMPRRGTTVRVVLPANRLVAAPGHGGLLNLL